MKRTIWKKKLHTEKKNYIFSNFFFFQNFWIKYLENGFIHFHHFFVCFGGLSGLTFAFGLEMEKNLSPSSDLKKNIFENLRKKAENFFDFFYERTWNLQSKSTFSKFCYDASFSSYSHFEHILWKSLLF